ncbi:hypothetical protein [Roseibium alexandrii]|uniref:hypothetical protein n=1 Tax=Roseibium alexandrii TaxID=388408 RepID=UPI003753150B
MLVVGLIQKVHGKLFGVSAFIGNKQHGSALLNSERAHEGGFDFGYFSACGLNFCFRFLSNGQGAKLRALSQIGHTLRKIRLAKQGKHLCKGLAVFGWGSNIRCSAGFGLPQGKITEKRAEWLFTRLRRQQGILLRLEPDGNAFVGRLWHGRFKVSNKKNPPLITRAGVVKFDCVVWSAWAVCGLFFAPGNFVHIEVGQGTQNRFPIFKVFEKIIKMVRTISQKVRHFISIYCLEKPPLIFSCSGAWCGFLIHPKMDLVPWLRSKTSQQNLPARLWIPDGQISFA